MFFQITDLSLHPIEPIRESKFSLPLLIASLFPHKIPISLPSYYFMSFSVIAVQWESHFCLGNEPIHSSYAKDSKNLCWVE